MVGLRQRDVMHKKISKIEIKLLSSDKLLHMSKGEVTKPETINYRTYKPEKGGLFCEKIFGPTKDWECSCGKYRGRRYKGIVCDKCGVEVNRRSLRRERIGHIDLAVPVVHIWFFRSLPSKIGNLLDYTVKTLEQVIYYEKYVVIKSGKIIDNYQKIIDEYKDYLDKYHIYISELEKIFIEAIKNGSKRDEAFDATDKFLENFEIDEKSFAALRDIIKEISDTVDGYVEEKYRSKEIKERIFSLLHDEDEEGFIEILAGVVPFDKEIMTIPAEEKNKIYLFIDLMKDLINREFLSIIKDIKYKSLISETDYNYIQDNIEDYEEDLDEGDWFEAQIGAEAVRSLLQRIDIKKEAFELRERIGVEKSANIKKKFLKKLEVLESFKNNLEKNKPEYMVLDNIPVIPPELRPLVPLEGGRFATSDLNDLYRRVIIRNNRLRKLIEIKAPEVIVRNEKRMIQEAVDSLLDNSKNNSVIRAGGNRAYKSLSDALKGKQGRFRNNLLGKRVDYSSRSVIVVGPDLKMNQCGLPKDMALELYKPFLIRRLVEYDNRIKTVKNAKREIEKKTDKVWELLEEVVQGHPVLLNRAPTLHRLGIQAFQPVLIEGKAIRLHPLACNAFNADFDGDQMAAHLPLSPEAILEARFLMLGSQNLLHPATGDPITVPTQDMVLGIYYMTKVREGAVGEGSLLSTIDEVHLALEFKKITYHSLIKYNMNGTFVSTTPGRILFNEILPKALREERYINEVLVKSRVEDIIADSIQKAGFSEAALFLDRLKNFGYKYATKSGISIGHEDFVISDKKEKVLTKTEKEIIKLRMNYEEGLITENERYNKAVDLWTKATNQIENDMFDNLREAESGFNPVYMMMDSKARGSKSQIKQICGIRGLMQKPERAVEETSKSVIENPIKTNFIDGLSILDYFISTHGARRGLADTALKTADAGYLTRKLVDVSQDVVIREDDCHTIMGIEMTALKEGDQIVESLADRLYGRILAEDIIDYSESAEGEVIARCGDLVTREIADKIGSTNFEKVKIRSVLTCESKKGVCAKCYGINLITGKIISEGEAVGIMAAQSIGEPGTQLTLRTFHVGGSADLAQIKSDIRSNSDGTVELNNVISVDNDGEQVVIRRNGVLRILDTQHKEVLKEKVPYSAKMLVDDGDSVKRGDRLFYWDPYNDTILSNKNGIVQFKDIILGSTYIVKVDEKINKKVKVMIEPKERRLKPEILIVDEQGEKLAKYLPPTGSSLQVEDGDKISAGHILVKMQRSQVKTKDITGGLPRVQELFEARNPKDPAIISEIDGKIKYGGYKGTSQQIVVEDINSSETRTYSVPRGKHILVHDGDMIYAGERITDGAIKPNDILKILGTNRVQTFLLNQIQEVYRDAGVKPNDKHIEIIIRQMLQKVRVIDSGDTKYLEGDNVSKYALTEENNRICNKLVILNPGDSDKYGIGDIVDAYQVEKINKKLEAKGVELMQTRKSKAATFQPLLLGITKASLNVDSFLSAASFQETTNVLTNAAVKSLTDYLEGLKENIVMGNLIPAGTGLPRFNYLKVKNKYEEEDAEINNAVSEVSE